MLIIKSRIKGIDKYIAPFKNEDGLYVATVISSVALENKLKSIGFPEVDYKGIKLIPKSIGPIQSLMQRAVMNCLSTFLWKRFITMLV